MGNLSAASSNGEIVAMKNPAQMADDKFNTDITMNGNLNLVEEWDKVFPQSNKVNHSKVTFRNRYGITLAADM